MFIHKILWIFMVLLHVYNVDTANILWIAGLASPSHQIWGGVLQRALAQRGHNITALSVDVDKIKTPNLTYLLMENVYEFYTNKTYNLSNMTNVNPLSAINALAQYRSDACIPAFQSEGLRMLMEYPRNFKFDLVIHDFVGAQCLLGFVPRFGNPPLVSLSASTCPVAISGASGNPQFPSIVPANHLDHGYNMDWLNRAYNFLLYAYDNAIRACFMLPTQNKLARVHFDDDSLDVAAISRSSVITLVNLAPSDVMQPFYQTVIPVGGLHIQNPKPLDSDVNAFIEGSEGAVIYFALGTNIKSEDFPSSKLEYFLEAFKKISPHRVLWKFDPKSMKSVLPDNVMLKKWMPQNDILAHPGVQVFIGHGGALSSQEAAWYGIPQLLIPFIIDQKQNAARAFERGIAIRLDHNNLTANAIEEAIKQLLHNKSFKNNALSISKSFRDQPQLPLERAIFWIEYVLRHGRQSRLRSPGQDNGLYEWIFVNIFTTIFIVIILQIFISQLKHKTHI